MFLATKLGISIDVQILSLGREIRSRGFDTSCLDMGCHHLVLSMEWVGLFRDPAEGENVEQNLGVKEEEKKGATAKKKLSDGRFGRVS